VSGTCGFCDFEAKNSAEALTHLLNDCKKVPRQTKRRLLREMEKTTKSHIRCKICHRPCEENLDPKCADCKNRQNSGVINPFLLRYGLKQGF